MLLLLLLYTLFAYSDTFCSNCVCVCVQFCLVISLRSNKKSAHWQTAATIRFRSLPFRSSNVNVRVNFSCHTKLVMNFLLLFFSLCSHVCSLTDCVLMVMCLQKESRWWSSSASGQEQKKRWSTKQKKLVH